MKKILYMDLEFHIKTSSTQFLYKLLEENFLVDKCFLDLGGRAEEVSQDYTNCYYDYLILFQAMPERRCIETFSYGKGILFPMYDSAVGKTIDEWTEYRDFTIINFSKTLHDYLSKNGFESRYIQYFPKPQEIKDYGNVNTLFLWQRTNQIHANQILSLCGNLNLKKVHIHKAVDPFFYYIGVDERFCYDFSYSNWFPEKSDLLEVMSRAAYYAAPRKYEGIGMGFLDAMAMGRCVIAPNQPTMNEYIDDGVNGILYDYENPRNIIVRDVRKLQENAHRSIERGYKKWMTDKYRIIEWIEEDIDKGTPILRPVDGVADAQRTMQENKYYTYYMFMNRWMILKNRKVSLGVWFESESAYRIAVYGYSEMASRLAEELKGTSVHIACYIDKENRWTNDGRHTVTINCFVADVDMVVVASFFYYNEIKEMIEKNFSLKVVSLEEIVDDLIKKL